MMLKLGMWLVSTHIDIVYEFAPFSTTRSIENGIFLVSIPAF